MSKFDSDAYMALLRRLQDQVRMRNEAIERVPEVEWNSVAASLRRLDRAVRELRACERALAWTPEELHLEQELDELAQAIAATSLANRRIKRQFTDIDPRFKR